MSLKIVRPLLDLQNLRASSECSRSTISKNLPHLKINRGNSKTTKKTPSCEILQKYIDSKNFDFCLKDENSGVIKREPLHYSLGLLINPRFVVCWKHEKSWTECQNEWKVLIQDLLFKFTMTKVKEFFNWGNNKALFKYFIECNNDVTKKFKSEVGFIKSLL